MILQIKPDAKPLCDVHHAPMQAAVFNLDIDMTFPAHRCSIPSCSRVYQHGQGYHDAETGQRISFEHRHRKQCPECDATMFLAAISVSEETWECGQVHCEHREVVKRDGEE